MGLTRAAVEDTLLRRCDQMLIAVGMDGSTRAGSNADLNDPIRQAARELGYPVADPILVADADLAPIADADVERLLDLAEKRALETCWGKWTAVDQQVDSDSQKLSQLADRLLARIEDLEAKIRRPYGLQVAGAVLAPIRAGRPRNDQSRGNPRHWPYR